MGETETRVDGDWPVSWEASRREQLRAMASASPSQRLEWLEQALRLADESGALRRTDTPERRRRRGLGPLLSS
jgi:hypothetical protein